MKKTIWFFTFIFFIVLITGCTLPSSSYTGEYVDMYSVANESLVWNNGKIMGADYFYSPKIKVIEKDSYNRVLFAYPVRCGKIEYVSLIIMQASNDENAWFYEDLNYICKKSKVEVGGNGEYEIKFSEEEKTKIKEQNDWGKQVDLSKCKKTKITKEYKTTFSTDLISLDESLFQQKWCVVFTATTDDYGRILIGLTDYERYFIAILNPDYSYDELAVIEVKEILNNQDEIKTLKEIDELSN
ncbi:MAG: hypothetical protein IJW64_06825 [Clostridia bacterium]|nr:hypothetical protein [Clostridia bacterium]